MKLKDPYDASLSLDASCIVSFGTCFRYQVVYTSPVIQTVQNTTSETSTDTISQVRPSDNSDAPFDFRKGLRSSGQTLHPIAVYCMRVCVRAGV